MTMKTMSRLGALAVLVVGGVHLQQYLTGYADIPTIGALFLLNAIGAAAVAAGLVAPVHRLLKDRTARLTTAVLATIGAMIAVGALVALFLSERRLSSPSSPPFSISVPASEPC